MEYEKRMYVTKFNHDTSEDKDVADEEKRNVEDEEEEKKNQNRLTAA